MASRKKENKKLPARWRYRYGAFRYRVPKNARHLWDNKAEFKLGATMTEALATWALRMGDHDSVNTMADAMDAYLIEHVPTLADGTQESYQGSIKRLRPVFGNMTPAMVQPIDAYGYYNATRKLRGMTTAKHDIQVLRHILTKCVEWGTLNNNALLGNVRLPSAPPRDRLIEDWEIEECMKVTGHQPRSINLAKLYIHFKLMTGLRRKDILTLQLSNLQEDGIHCQPSKTAKSSGKRLIIYWTDELRELIKDIKSIPPHRIGNATLFTTKHGKPYSKNSFDSLWARFMDRAMEQTAIVDRFQERDLRAKVGSDSSSLIEASERLGHASTETTQKIYRRKPVGVWPLGRPKG